MLNCFDLMRRAGVRTLGPQMRRSTTTTTTTAAAQICIPHMCAQSSPVRRSSHLILCHARLSWAGGLIAILAFDREVLALRIIGSGQSQLDLAELETVSRSWSFVTCQLFKLIWTSYLRRNVLDCTRAVYIVFLLLSTTL